jgi:serine/threonine-protein kinase
MVSPDGRWLTYQSNESGAWDIYVQPFDAAAGATGGPRSIVSTTGGTQPRWSTDGRELFYLSPRNEMMHVRVGAGPTWSATQPERLFDAGGYFLGGEGNPYLMYDVAKDGRFLMVKPVGGGGTDADASENVTVVLNWIEELNRLGPSR